VPVALHELLWRENLDVAQACLHRPFVRSLADGRLDFSAFRRYVAEDAFFLEAFARAYALGIAHSRNSATLRQFHALLNAAIEELRLHAAYAEKLKIDLGRVEPCAATRAYTDFLLATAWGADLGETVAAMTPCMRLYAYLGEQLAEEVGRPSLGSHPFGDWIATYSGAEFQAATRLLESLLDSLAGDGPQIRGVYRYAMQCELRFFSAPLEEEP